MDRMSGNSPVDSFFFLIIKKSSVNKRSLICVSSFITAFGTSVKRLGLLITKNWLKIACYIVILSVSLSELAPLLPSVKVS